MGQFQYITTNPKILGGKPIIKDTRISVEFILELLASGAAVKDIVEAYPHLSEEAVKEAIYCSGEKSVIYETTFADGMSAAGAIALFKVDGKWKIEPH